MYMNNSTNCKLQANDCTSWNNRRQQASHYSYY